MKSTPGPTLLPGISALIASANDAIRSAASNDEPVFITGEIGTEKAFAAKLIHQMSARGNRPISKVSVSWKLPPDLAQYFQQGAGGTLIIHLQKEFPVDMQYTLVELASDGAFADPMTGEVVESDVRIILMTSLDFDTLTHRTPLLPELNEILISQHIEIPPLRDRLEDIPALVRYALARAADTGRTTAKSVNPQVLALFRHWQWPGNAEDLLLVTAQGAIAAKGDSVTIDDLPETFLKQFEEEVLKAARQMRAPAAVSTARRATPSAGTTRTPSQVDESEEPTEFFSTIRRPITSAASEEVTELNNESLRALAMQSESDIEPPFSPSDETTQELSREAAAGIPPPPPQQEPIERIEVPEETIGRENAEQLAQRVLSLARRLRAQSTLLKSQMAGPLAHNEASARLEPAPVVHDDQEALAALELELDRGLDMVYSLRRQLAILNVRQQQSAETIRDLVQRISLLNDDYAAVDDREDREETLRDARELADTLGQIDTIVQRVSQEIPVLGKHFQDIIGSPE